MPHVLSFSDAAEKEAKVKESVERAKEAVALDVKDGTSWSKPELSSDDLYLVYANFLCTVVLGNAYLSLFFMTNQDPKLLKQCVSAYNQAVS